MEPVALVLVPAQLQAMSQPLSGLPCCPLGCLFCVHRALPEVSLRPWLILSLLCVLWPSWPGTHTLATRMAR